jgi:hypothetical protein
MGRASYPRSVRSEPFYLNSEDYRKFVLQQIEEQRELVRDLGLKAN